MLRWLFHLLIVFNLSVYKYFYELWFSSFIMLPKISQNILIHSWGEQSITLIRILIHEYCKIFDNLNHFPCVHEACEWHGRWMMLLLLGNQPQLHLKKKWFGCGMRECTLSFFQSEKFQCVVVRGKGEKPQVMWIPQVHSLIPITRLTQFTQVELQPYLYSYCSTVFKQLGRTQAETFSGTGELVAVEMAMVGWKSTGITRELCIRSTWRVGCFLLSYILLVFPW